MKDQLLTYERFYEESNETNLAGNFIGWITIILVTLIGGYIYGILISLSPLVYFNAMLTVAFGLTIWVTIRCLIRLTHNRSKRNQMTMVIAAGIFAVYFQFTSYYTCKTNVGVPTFDTYLQDTGWIFSPADFFNTIGFFLQHGEWSLFWVPFKGPLLAGVWIIEAGIIAIMPAMIISRSVAYPYSENLSKWYPRFTLDRDFETVVGRALVPELAENSLEALKKLGRGAALRSTKFHVYYIRDEEHQYLTAEIVSTESQTGYKSGTKVINNFRISKHEAEVILAHFTHRRKRAEVL